MFEKNHKKSSARQVKDWIELNPSKAQFFVTIAVLIATILFSYLSLRETRKQYKLANEQLKLAKEQFKSNIDQRNADLALSKKKDIAISKKEINDSIRLAKIDLQQQKNSKFQNSINQQQLQINKQQLLAIQKQAEVAKSQFEFQQLQSEQQYEDNRPIFSIDSVKINKYSLAYNNVSFHVENTGKRLVFVDSTFFAVWNPKYIFYRNRLSITGSFLRDAGLYLAGVPVFAEYINNENTFYCIVYFYKDSADKNNTIFVDFFKYTSTPKKDFLRLAVRFEEKQEFIKQILKHPSPFHKAAELQQAK